MLIFNLFIYLMAFKTLLNKNIKPVLRWNISVTLD